MSFLLPLYYRIVFIVASRSRVVIEQFCIPLREPQKASPRITIIIHFLIGLARVFYASFLAVTAQRIIPALTETQELVKAAHLASVPALLLISRLRPDNISPRSPHGFLLRLANGPAHPHNPHHAPRPVHRPSPASPGAWQTTHKRQPCPHEAVAGPGTADDGGTGRRAEVDDLHARGYADAVVSEELGGRAATQADQRRRLEVW